MAIIDKIRLSGTTYDIVDQSKAKVIEVTQQQYDAIVTPEANAIYVITDAPAIDISDFYNKSTINAMMALKQDVLVSGTNIKTINNESILGSGNITIQGGSTYTAGRGISIANDEIALSLPIYQGGSSTSIVIGGTSSNATGTLCAAIGEGCKALAAYSLANGFYSSAVTYYSQAIGRYVKTSNWYEHSVGNFNNTVSGSSTFGDSGNTLMAVGNGNSENARHNAFEVRQSGDIYVANTDDTTDTSSTGYSTKPMVRLQDTITATAANTAALSGKQDVLVSGTNIKTINNESILGSGNITIQGGGSVTIDPTLDSGSTNAVANSAITAAIDAAKAYYIDFGVLTTQGIHDADWDGMVAAINAHRPIYAGVPGTNGLLYYTAECLYQDGSNIIRMTASDNSAHYFYTFTKNGSEDYSFSYQTRPYTTDAEKAAWNAKADVSAVTAISDSLSGKADVSAVTAVADSLSGKVNTSAVTSSVTSSSTDVVTSGGVYEQMGGLKLMKCTQAQYDAIVTKDANTLYIVS